MKNWYCLIFVMSPLTCYAVFDWPVEGGSPKDISQDYGTYGDVYPGFHVGIDIGSGGVGCDPETGAKEQITIRRTSSDAVVVKIIRLGKDDKGFGNTVITQHEGPIYTQYSHLDSIDSKIVVGKKLEQGDAIGIMGGSGSGMLCRFPVHLHFEVKKFDSLVPPGYSGEPGYTPNTPSIFGYRDPIQYFHNLDASFIPAGMESIATEALRVGPGEEYPKIPPQFNDAYTRIEQGQHYVATNKTVDDWYQIHIPTMRRSGKKMGVHDGWAKALISPFVETLITPGVSLLPPGPLSKAFVWNVGEGGLNIRKSPSATDDVLANVWDSQEVTYSRSEDGWYEIDLPATEQSSAQKSWLSGEYLFSRCHRFDNDDQIDGWGASYNVFSTEQELALNAYCNTNEQYAHVTGGNPRLRYIYHFGHEYFDNSWHQINFECNGLVVADSWCSGHVSTLLSLKAEFYVAYTCNWIIQEEKWKCGCQDTECTTGFWQLQGVKR